MEDLASALKACDRESHASADVGNMILLVNELNCRILAADKSLNEAQSKNSSLEDTLKMKKAALDDTMMKRKAVSEATERALLSLNSLKGLLQQTEIGLSKVDDKRLQLTHDLSRGKILLGAEQNIRHLIDKELQDLIHQKESQEFGTINAQIDNIQCQIDLCRKSHGEKVLLYGSHKMLKAQIMTEECKLRNIEAGIKKLNSELLHLQAEHNDLDKNRQFLKKQIDKLTG